MPGLFILITRVLNNIFILGLVNGKIKEIQWGDVDGWVSQGGANLGKLKIINYLIK